MQDFPKQHKTAVERRLIGGLWCALQLMGVWLALCLASASVHAQDEDKLQAKERFERGVVEYDAGRYAEALDDFQEAYRLKPHPLVRVNIANCYDKLDRPVEAIFHFDLFMASKHGSSQQRDEIKDALKSLRKRVGKLALSVSPDGARVSIDSTEERRAPIMEPIALKVGTHELVVSLDGYDTLTRSVEVKPESTTELTLRLTRPAVTVAPMPLPAPVAGSEPEPAPQAAPSAPEEEIASVEPVESAPSEATQSDAEPSSEDGIPTSVWIVGGASVSLAVAGVITGVLANSAEDNFNDNRRARFDPALTADQQQIAWQQGNDAADRATALAVTTDLLFSGAIVGAAVTVYLYLSRDRGESGSAVLMQHGVPTLRASF